MEEKAGFNDINIKTIDEFKKYAIDRIPSIVAEKDYQTILEKLNLLKDKKLKTDHLFKPRNILLADVFYKAGFIESWGRGTIKIIEKYREQGLPEPDFEEEHGVFTVRFYQDKWNEENLKKLGLSERQTKEVIYVKEKRSINLSSFKTLIQKISKKTLYRDLQDLVDKGILKEIGKKKGRKYELR